MPANSRSVGGCQKRWDFDPFSKGKGPKRTGGSNPLCSTKRHRETVGSDGSPVPFRRQRLELESPKTTIASPGSPIGVEFISVILGSGGCQKTRGYASTFPRQKPHPTVGDFRLGALTYGEGREGVIRIWSCSVYRKHRLPARLHRRAGLSTSFRTICTRSGGPKRGCPR
jgi:hypothetical protein